MVDRTKEQLGPAIAQNVEANSIIHTDEHTAYAHLNDPYEREVITHAMEYVNGHIHTNGIENFWACLKRSLGGTYISDEPFHLDAYVAEQVFRYNNRKDSDDATRFASCIMGVQGKRLTGIAQKSAWFVLQRLRLVLKNIQPAKLGNHAEPVQMDESFHGGTPRNMHRDKRKQMFIAANGSYPAKTAVFGMLDSKTREVRAMVVPKVKRATLQRIILDNVGFGATIHTDQSPVYDGLRWYVHETVNHLETYVTETGVHTNSIENFWSLLKRTLQGTYVAVEPLHMDRYLDEATFRFNNRLDMNDGTRFQKALGQVAGRRLTWNELTRQQVSKGA